MRRVRAKTDMGRRKGGGTLEYGSWTPAKLERVHGPQKAAICAPEPEKTELGRVSVLECASPLTLWKSWVVESTRGLAHSKTLRRYERFTEPSPGRRGRGTG